MTRTCRDSFLHYINDNIAAGVVVHPLRRDPTNRAADALQMNAVNVSFLNLTAGNGTTLCTQQCVIAVVADDENAAVDMVGSVLELLRAAYFCPMLDYTVPTAPVQIGTNITWDRKRVTFKRVQSEGYCHYSCLLSLRFYSQ